MTDRRTLRKVCGEEIKAHDTTKPKIPTEKELWLEWCKRTLNLNNKELQLLNRYQGHSMPFKKSQRYTYANPTEEALLQQTLKRVKNELRLSYQKMEVLLKEGYGFQYSHEEIRKIITRHVPHPDLQALIDELKRKKMIDENERKALETIIYSHYTGGESSDFWTTLLEIMHELSKSFK